VITFSTDFKRSPVLFIEQSYVVQESNLKALAPIVVEAMIVVKLDSFASRCSSWQDETMSIVACPRSAWLRQKAFVFAAVEALVLSLIQGKKLVLAQPNSCRISRIFTWIPPLLLNSPRVKGWNHCESLFSL